LTTINLCIHVNLTYIYFFMDTLILLLFFFSKQVEVLKVVVGVVVGVGVEDQGDSWKGVTCNKDLMSWRNQMAVVLLKMDNGVFQNFNHPRREKGVDFGWEKLLHFVIPIYTHATCTYTHTHTHTHVLKTYTLLLFNVTRWRYICSGAQAVAWK